ncbi:hypothetical protein [Chryseobacterium sp. LAM-KRS1]|nr:hypothetical protein [Chryseobacterium sp. LAM-KRS1]
MSSCLLDMGKELLIAVLNAIGDNSSEEGKAQNRRVELAKK